LTSEEASDSCIQLCTSHLCIFNIFNRVELFRVGIFLKSAINGLRKPHLLSFV